MKELLRAGCELLADNKEEIRKNFQWDYDIMSVSGSVIFTGAGKRADIVGMKECKKILTKKEGVFSEFRSNMEIPVISKMALSDDPEEYLRNLNSVYNRLHAGKIFGSEHMVLTSMCICDCNVMDRVDAIIEKTKILLKKMGEEHPFLTSDEDMALASLLSMTDKSVDQIIDETEECFETLKRIFPGHSNAVQSLSHVLTLEEGSVQEKCARVGAIYDALLTKKLVFGKDRELAALGTLVNIEATPEEIANDIFEAAEFLKDRKGFGDWGMGQKSRLMFAALVVAMAYAPCSVADSAMLGSTIALVIAQEITMMLIMVSCMSSST